MSIKFGRLLLLGNINMYIISPYIFRWDESKIKVTGSKSKNIAITIKRWLSRHTAGVVSTTDNECDQQVETVALCWQHGTDIRRVSVVVVGKHPYRVPLMINFTILHLLIYSIHIMYIIYVVFIVCLILQCKRLPGPFSFNKLIAWYRLLYVICI